MKRRTGGTQAHDEYPCRKALANFTQPVWDPMPRICRSRCPFQLFLIEEGTKVTPTSSYAHTRGQSFAYVVPRPAQPSPFSVTWRVWFAARFYRVLVQ